MRPASHSEDLVGRTSRRAPVRQFPSLVVACTLALAWGAGSARAHREIEVQLQALDRSIISQPNDELLYLRRADLHRRHRDWERALADLDRASALAPGRIETCLGRAQTLLDMGQVGRALNTVDRYLQEHPEARAAAALAQLEARCARRLGQLDRARTAYHRALANIERPTPDLFLEAAETIMETGRSGAPREAIALLDEGSRRLGFAPVLERRALELEQSAGWLEAAARRCDRVLRHDGRPRPDWLILSGQTLLAMGRNDAASEAFQAALTLHEVLPPARRTSPAQAALAADARQGLAAALARGPAQSHENH